MSDGNLFKYGGRRGDSLPMFTNGECGMWMNSSAYYGSISIAGRNSNFGQTMLPLDTGVADAAAELDHRRRDPVGAGRA